MSAPPSRTPRPHAIAHPRSPASVHPLATLATTALVACLAALLLFPRLTGAQAPLTGGLTGASLEANVFGQGVTNRFGDWSGLYVRGIKPMTSDTWYADLLALRAFGLRGTQVGLAHRHDWNRRIFHAIGGNMGDGSPIVPRYRVDGSVGLRMGNRSQWQVTAGGSFVQSITELHDVAATGSIAWFAPRIVVLELSARLNTSNPGNVKSQRIAGLVTVTPSQRRSFSLRTIGGTEGWQIISSTRTLQQFASQEVSLSWREKLTPRWALSVQGDLYRNPFYLRSGVTLGAARYW